MNIRKKIADSSLFNRSIEAVLAGYIRIAYATSKWEKDGFEAMDEVLAREEPIIFCVWHQRLVLAPYMFDQSKGKFCSLTSSARAGRLVGSVFKRFGFDTVPMPSHKRNVALSREVLSRIKDGYTIGIAVDGPRGPARIASSTPIVWARASGLSVFVLSWSARRVITLPLWDKCMLPIPFGRGILMCRRWDIAIPRKLSDEESEALRLGLQEELNNITHDSDHSQGRRPKTALSEGSNPPTPLV